MSQKQQTIKEAVSISGVGLHTGKEVTITFKPAPENHGFKFQRTDLEGTPVVPADVNLVTDTERGTTLEKDGVRIHTVEHTLAALVGLSLDNILMELDAPEPPILDGSSRIFIDTLEKAGIEEQKAERVYFEIEEPIHFSMPEKGIELFAIPADEYQVTVMVDYESKVLASQNAAMNSISEFKDAFSDARTFCFLHELELLLEHNLIKGGDVSNAIVYVDRVVSDEELGRLAKVFDKEDVAVQENGVLNNIELHYPNEAARHKLLDVVGDLALVGMPIKGRIIANRPGHMANVAFGKLIKQAIRKQAKNQAPKYDPAVEPLMDVTAIQKMLPHRPPFLLVDKIIDLSQTHVTGIKNVTMNEPFFEGHFPGAPVMPGVLQIEALAQAGGILVLNTVPDPENYLTYFMKIVEAKFKQKVVPGDTLVLHLELLTPIRRGIAHMKAQAFVGNRLTSEAELMAQIVKEK